MSRQQRRSSSLRLYASALEINHNILGKITLRRSSRARRISISVLRSGEVRLTLPVRGDEALALHFLEERLPWIITARERVAKRVDNTAPRLSEAEVEALRIRAKGYLPQRLAELASQFGFRYGRVTIRPSRSRWGSCSVATKNISLSLFLMMLPAHLIDFVILHELTHTIHPNHSPRFHKALDHCLSGRERELIKELRGYHLPPR